MRCIVVRYFKTKHGIYYLGDARELIKKIPTESVDLILTDPPYGYNMDKYDDPSVFFEIEPELYRVLKNNRFMLVYYGTKALPSVFKLKKFEYTWIIVVLETPTMGKRWCPVGFTYIQFIVVFRKGKAKPVIHAEDYVINSDQIGLIDKEIVKEIYRSGAKRQFKNTSGIHSLLRRFSSIGDLVLDPFAGYGSIPLTCELFKRRWIAFEIDEIKYEYAKKLFETIYGGVEEHVG